MSIRWWGYNKTVYKKIGSKTHDPTDYKHKDNNLNLQTIIHFVRNIILGLRIKNAIKLCKH